VGTFLYFRPLKSLQVWDDDAAGNAAMQKAMTDAEGGEEAARKLRMTGADLVAASDTSAYAMNPKISRPGPEFAKFDLAFWSPKPAETRTAAAAPAKAEASKPPAGVKKDAPKQ
jgi:hypothetical protein